MRTRVTTEAGKDARNISATLHGPVAGAQPDNRLQRLAGTMDGSAAVGGLRALADRISLGPRMVAQRHALAQWRSRSAARSTAAPVAQLGRTPSSKILEKLKGPQEPLSHRRSTTAYGYFNKAGKRRQNGAHFSSHISTAVAIEVALRSGRKLSSLVGTKLVPRPRAARHILRKLFDPPGISDAKKIKRRKEARKAMTAYLKRYVTLFRKAKKGDKRAIQQLVELHPLQTYNLYKGETTSAELAGKGERRASAADDLRRLAALRKGGKLPGGLKAVDDSSLGSVYLRPVARLLVDRVRNLGRLAATDDPLSDDESIGSDSDSEVELED